ncbi:MAG: PIN domain-containing protein [Dehalococcoidia bacterium]
MTADVTTFVDTNVLVYAYDLDAGGRHDTARALMADLWVTRRGVTSTQVLQEFYVTVTRKLAAPLGRAVARQIVETYLAWPIQTVDPADVLSASSLEEQHSLSFWDALIIVSAQHAGADRLLSEDLQAGRRIAGMSIENPFA